MQKFRPILEWVIPIAIIVILYLTGYHTEVIGRIQQVVLKTGLISPGKINSDAEEKLSSPFTLLDLNGNTKVIDPGDGKVYFINFWASWCPPCVAEMPDIEALYVQMEDQENLEFIMVNLDQDPAKRDAFLKRKNFDLPFYSPAGGIPKQLSSPSIPATFIIDKQGSIVLKHSGMASYNTSGFKKKLSDLAAE